MKPSVSSPRGVVRVLRRGVVMFLVGTIAAGVSVPAGAAPPSKEPAARRDREERHRLRESQGQRGHIGRRNDVVPRRSHVEKKPGWRRID